MTKSSPTSANNAGAAGPGQYYYSNIQYFFWLLSGCEIKVLKECPTDYNRQAGIGFTIFMTTVFAAFAGGYAGYYFSNHNLMATVLFGMLWSALIFSIDRSMVITLKKDPTAVKQNFWGPLAGRGILSLLIAFIISIPLELLVFKSQIDIQKRFDTPNQLANIAAMYKKAGNYNEHQEARNTAKETADNALKAANDCMQDAAYAGYAAQSGTINNNLAGAKKTLVTFENRYRDIREQARRMANEYERNNRFATARTFYNSNAFQNARAEVKRLNNKLADVKTQMDDRCATFRQQQTAIAQENQDEAKKRQAQMDITQTVADKESDTLKALLTDNFIRDYIALENAAVQKIAVEDSVQVTVPGSSKPAMRKVVHTKYANAGLLFFVWLFRILFFVIELLPTITKIFTPAGAYDQAIYQREQDFRQELDRRSGAFINHMLQMKAIAFDEEKRRLHEQHGIEGQLRKDLLQEIAKAQDEVARKKIQEYRNKHLNNTTV